MTGVHGRFVWYELLTTDTTAAQGFYQSVLGWTFRDSGIPGEQYSILSAGEVPVAGMMALPEEVRAKGVGPHWGGYIAVDDVEAIVARVTEKGGTLHRAPEDIPGVGRFAVLADPQGAVFTAFRPGSSEATPQCTPGTPGTGGWRELHTSDPEAAFAFYAELFGWTKGEAMDMGPMGTYQIVQREDMMFGGIMKNQTPGHPFWLYYFNVADIDHAQTLVQDGGGQVLHGPQQVPGGSWILNCLDPQGAAFALVGPRA